MRSWLGSDRYQRDGDSTAGYGIPLSPSSVFPRTLLLLLAVWNEESFEHALRGCSRHISEIYKFWGVPCVAAGIIGGIGAMFYQAHMTLLLTVSKMA